MRLLFAASTAALAFGGRNGSNGHAPSAQALLPLFFHSNYRFESPPPGFRVVSSWWWDRHLAEARVEHSKYKRMIPYRGRTRKPLPIQFATPHQWQWVVESARSANLSSQLRLPPEAPWLFLDTDIIMQCSAAEFIARWRAFDSPLVVGAETLWSPKHDWARNPYPEVPSKLRYPNSGAIMGTAAAYEQVARVQESFPRFPCCPMVYRGVHSPWCYVEAQHCTQAALQNESVSYALDSNASLFLQLNSINETEELEQLPSGRYRFRRTGTVPCVLHFNGAGDGPALFRMVAMAERSPPSSYVPLWERWLNLTKRDRAEAEQARAELEASRHAGRHAGAHVGAHAGGNLRPAGGKRAERPVSFAAARNRARREQAGQLGAIPLEERSPAHVGRRERLSCEGVQSGG